MRYSLTPEELLPSLRRIFIRFLGYFNVRVGVRETEVSRLRALENAETCASVMNITENIESSPIALFVAFVSVI